MLIEYINKAMSKAVYEKVEDGSYAGRIPANPWCDRLWRDSLSMSRGIEVRP